MTPIVLDTNVFVAALRSEGGASRVVLRRALQGRYQPLFGNALLLEYQDLLGRPVWGEATNSAERLEVLAALASQGRWVRVYYGWRPNLPDDTAERLKALARSRGLSMNKLVEELSAQALSAWDTENHFRALAATGDVQRALAVLDRLDADDRREPQHG